MNSISYFYRNVLKERIKSKINSITDEIIDAFLDSLIDISASNKYASLVSEMQEKMRKLILEVMVATFEEIDKGFAESIERKAKYNINKSNVERTLVTILGPITFKRTYYVSKLDNSKLFFIDHVFGLPKYDHYDPVVKAIAIDKAFSTNQAQAGRDTGEQISNIKDVCENRDILHIPRQSIHNWINEWKTPKNVYDTVDTPETLYIMADEKFLGCQNLDGDIMAKCMIAFEGVEKVGKNRNALINKTVFTTYGSDPWKQFADILVQKYDFDKIENIKFISDGATWIKSGIEELRMNSRVIIERLLCEFHFKQAINHITTDKDMRKELISIFNTKSKNEFETKVNKILDDITEDKRKETINTKLNYILNNYKAIKDMINSPIGSSMEAHISHYISSLFASRPKGYSSEKINHYLTINDYKINGINLINLYLQSYNNKEIVSINEEELNYSIFDKKQGIPVLNSGENTGLYHAIHSLAY